MGLKLIPLEGIQKKAKSGKISKIMAIRAKLDKKTSNAEEKHLRKTCNKLIEYLVGKGKCSLSGIDRLIDDMELSVLKMKKRRLELQKKASKKRK